MAPPPATPTPHRFLVPRRSQPRSETPSAAFQPSSQQFQATPRFSLHSTPRKGPPSSVTPFRNRGTGPGIAIDTSPPPPPGKDPVVDYDNASDHDDYDTLDDEYQRTHGDHGRDLIIDEDEDGYGEEAAQQSSPPALDSDREGADMSDGERRVKRRRISISFPEVDVKESQSSLSEAEHSLDVEMQDAASAIENLNSEPTISEFGVGSDKGVTQDAAHNAQGGPLDHGGKLLVRSTQPTFQKAPRFKPAELPEGAPYPEPLPDAFSPRRKGAKYVAGGLAAELRDWLIDVEAGFGSGSTATSTARDGEWVAKIQVNDMSATHPSAQGMKLVLGRQILSNPVKASNAIDNDQTRDGNQAAIETLGNSTLKLILAGPGRLSGLGVGNDVRPGVVLGIARPTWEIVLDGLGRLGVACDWVVLR